MISDIFIPFWCETEEKAAPILSDRADGRSCGLAAKEKEISGTVFETKAEE
ncbi:MULTISPECIES: hypothetical protein [Bradyrhizobium]|uniref:Uncharacterized protein n=1 Tax=Bradyrhizobium brasilense TaxID=1419277 RepID=A0ABY8JTI3_9BRAD|nr:MULTISPECIES: hypothetical protein [Bradyrhizobium]MCA1396555.1 hypothetical protein [Bradyrhizobium sp. BRP56]MCP1831845.1 hypothetical protein [Bradyrhizobium sp. USDA 4545]MCP1850779.1 hypothetical protein [Bradyrhizobium sp. USDA 4541]MCP1916681.1 hypothetical protein [Bradyrhizobium sp. USDA 4532]MCP3413948.1 hypothetical protein [Bradyrhizobium brasilense]